MRTRRIALALLALSFVVAASVALPPRPGPALADASVLASLELLDPPPSYHTSGPNTVVHSSPAVADLDGDGRPEIVVATHPGLLYVLRFDGHSLSVAPGWPRAVGAHIGSSPAVGDLDGDGTPEIVIGIGEPDDNNTAQL